MSATVTVTRQEFLDEAKSWEGVPWLHQGRSRNGVDCIGLLLVVCWELGLSTYDAKAYGRTPYREFMKQECERLMERTFNPQLGDVHLIRLSKELLHVGIKSKLGILHAWGGSGVHKVADVPLSTVWQNRIIASYHVPGVV